MISSGVNLCARKSAGIINWYDEKAVFFLFYIQIINVIVFYSVDQMVDANQIWDVNEAIDWMTQLTDYKLLWIEEPTSPDDILGHATIAKALR